MLKYIAKRIGLALITIFTVATLTFFLMNMVRWSVPLGESSKPCCTGSPGGKIWTGQAFVPAVSDVYERCFAR